MKKMLSTCCGVFFLVGGVLGMLERTSFAKISGAIFTTDKGCVAVNENIYPNKEGVYLDGGPHRTGAAGLPDGNYYVTVTEPNGTVLGKSLKATVTVTGGEFANCYPLESLVNSASSNFANPGFDTTSNAGGEYKVLVCSDESCEPSKSKSDNFKVKGQSDSPNDEGGQIPVGRTGTSPNDQPVLMDSTTPQKQETGGTRAPNLRAKPPRACSNFDYANCLCPSQDKEACEKERAAEKAKQ
jgi:hypothetical protein